MRLPLFPEPVGSPSLTPDLFTLGAVALDASSARKLLPQLLPDILGTQTSASVVSQGCFPDPPFLQPPQAEGQRFLQQTPGRLDQASGWSKVQRLVTASKSPNIYENTHSQAPAPALAPRILIQKVQVKPRKLYFVSKRHFKVSELLG